VDWDKAAELYALSAAQDNIDGCMRLSACLFEGKGVPQDKVRAFELVERGAKSGRPEAMDWIGTHYWVDGAEQDFVKAASWFARGASAGHAECQGHLALCYFEGKGVDKDDEAAFKWSMAAAKQGLRGAYVCVARCYMHGQGVERDAAKALPWLVKGGEAGDVIAQLELGQYYQSRDGEEEEGARDEAMRWFQASAEEGNARAMAQLSYGYTKIYTDMYSSLSDQQRDEYHEARKECAIQSACAGDEMGNYLLGVLGLEMEMKNLLTWMRPIPPPAPSSLPFSNLPPRKVSPRLWINWDDYTRRGRSDWNRTGSRLPSGTGKRTKPKQVTPQLATRWPRSVAKAATVSSGTPPRWRCTS
jgi:hypothetical protein